MSRLEKMWDSIQRTMFSSAGPITRQQVSVVVGYSILGFLSLVVFGVLHIFADEDALLGSLEIAGGGVIALNVLGMRATRNVILARNILLLTILTMLVVMLITGGVHESGVFWFFVLPVSAFFLTGKKLGLLWVLGLFVVTIGVMLLAETPYVSTPYEWTTIRQLLVSLAVVTIGVYVYQHSRENLENQSRSDELSLAEANIRADTVIENIGEGVIATDQEGKICIFNEAAGTMLGWKEEEVIGREFVDIVPVLDNQGRLIEFKDRSVTQLLQNYSYRKLALTYARKDRTTFPVAIASRSVTVDGKIQGTIWTFRDVSEEQAIDRAKTEFVTLASHQLRTPVSAIAWVSELLLSGDAGKMTDEQQEYLEQISSSNKRLANLLDAMLAVSSLELGDFPIKSESIDASVICREVVKEFQQIIEEKKLVLTEKYEAADVYCDPNALKVIYRNIVSNACKYTPSKGSISIRVAWQGEDQKDLHIEVADSGFGVPRRQQSKIFTKLFRADNVKQKDTDGTGLGLYIARSLVERLGGHISFESEERKGSTFHIYLPRGKGPEKGRSKK